MCWRGVSDDFTGISHSVFFFSKREMKTEKSIENRMNYFFSYFFVFLNEIHLSDEKKAKSISKCNTIDLIFSLKEGTTSNEKKSLFQNRLDLNFLLWLALTNVRKWLKRIFMHLMLQYQLEIGICFFLQDFLSVLWHWNQRFKISFKRRRISENNRFLFHINWLLFLTFIEWNIYVVARLYLHWICEYVRKKDDEE